MAIAECPQSHQVRGIVVAAILAAGDRLGAGGRGISTASVAVTAAGAVERLFADAFVRPAAVEILGAGEVRAFKAGHSGNWFCVIEHVVFLLIDKIENQVASSPKARVPAWL